MKKLFLHITMLIAMCLLAPSCSVDKYIPEGSYLLDRVSVTCDDEELMKTYLLNDYATQNTNTKWFGARVPLRIYCLSGQDTTKSRTRLLRRIGEAPVLYDSLTSSKIVGDMKKVLGNAGYMKAEVSQVKDVRGKKMALEYHISPNERYTLRNVDRLVDDEGLRHFVCVEDTANSLVKEDYPLDVNMLNGERNRIANYLRNNGYYKFTKDNVKFSADTAANSTEVDLTIIVKKHQENGRVKASEHKKYTIGDVHFLTDVVSGKGNIDTLKYRGFYFLSQNGNVKFRKKLLASHSLIRTGDLYNEQKFKRTYNNYTRLGAVAYSSVQFNERPGEDILDCDITINHAKENSFGVDVEATNSAGDLGAALSTSFQNRNLFNGSESFLFKIRGAYEAITGLEGYEGNNYVEFGAEARLGFPAFLFPYVKREWGMLHNASSEISLQYNLQNRPEFQRRVLSAAWRYKWSSRDAHIQHKFDLLEVSYVYMPWISRTFKEQYLDSLGKTNAILKYNYENQLITKLGYTYTYNSLGAREQTYGKNAYTVKFNIETSGNVLYGISNMAGAKKNDMGQYEFCGIGYAQYVRGDLDLAKSIKIDKNNSVAFHGAFGVAYPYGNSKQLPFEKRYFAGGANSVRGWSVRSLGPGKYNGKDKGINFLNQSGDIKIDLSMEFRAKLFWKFSGAAFVDAGNIWTIRDYEDQPGGAFRIDKFYDQIAVAYGIGLRMDANFFIVRFDGGMKAVNPMYSGKEHYPIFHPVFSRDFAFHFAVGLPF